MRSASRTIALILIGFLMGVAFLQLVFKIWPRFIPPRPFVPAPEVHTDYEEVVEPTDAL